MEEQFKQKRLNYNRQPRASKLKKKERKQNKKDREGGAQRVVQTKTSLGRRRRGPRFRCPEENQNEQQNRTKKSS